MIGIIFLAVLGGYILLARLIMKRMPSRKARYIVAAIFILIPTWDMIPSWLYLEYLCKTEGGLKIYKTVDNVEGFYIKDADANSVKRQLIPNYKFQIWGKGQWLDGITYEPNSYLVNPKDTYKFVETGRNGTYYRYYLGNDEKVIEEKVIEEKVESLSSKYSLEGGWSNEVMNIDKLQYKIIDSETKDVLATLTSYSSYTGWLQRALSPVAGKSLSCDSLVIFDVLYFSTLKPVQ